jgi:hypothetical protein
MPEIQARKRKIMQMSYDQSFIASRSKEKRKTPMGAQRILSIQKRQCLHATNEPSTMYSNK